MSNNNFNCTFDGCDRSFKAKKTMQNHVSTDHEGHAKAKKAEKAEYCCKYCGNPFNDKSNMYTHIRNTCDKSPKDGKIKKQALKNEFVKNCVINRQETE